MPMPDPDQIPPELWKQLNITKEQFLAIRREMEKIVFGSYT
jgi:hypothetical protein